MQGSGCRNSTSVARAASVQAAFPLRGLKGSYLRLIDFVHHLTLGLRVIKKKEEDLPGLWVVRVGGDDGELRPWHYIYEGRRG